MIYKDYANQIWSKDLFLHYFLPIHKLKLSLLKVPFVFAFL